MPGFVIDWKILRPLLTPIETIQKFGFRSYLESLLIQPPKASELLANCPWLALRGNPYHELHNPAGHKSDLVDQIDLLILGNSMVHDLYSPAAETWPFMLGQMTGSRTYNAAIGGASPLQYLLTLAEVAHLAPKKVFFTFFSGNNVFNSINSLRKLHTPAGTAFRYFLGDPVERRGCLVANETQRILSELKQLSRREAIIEATARGAKDCEHVVADGFELFSTPYSAVNRLDLSEAGNRYGMNVALACIDAAASLCDEISAELSVIYIPMRESLINRAIAHSPEIYAKIARMEDDVRDDVARQCVSNGAQMIDLTNGIHDALGDGFYPADTDDLHPTMFGKRRIARLVARTL